MPIFQLERYEIHSQRVSIRADSMAEAIEAVMQGSGDNVGELQFIESCDDLGMTPDEQLAKELDQAGIDLYEGHIAGIRSIKQLSKY